MTALLIIGIVLSGIRFFWSILCLIAAKSGKAEGEVGATAKVWAFGFIPASFYIVAFSIVLASL